MNTEYERHVAEREALGIPPLPLSAEQVGVLTTELLSPARVDGDLLLSLLARRVPPGVDPAAEGKAAFLRRVTLGELHCPLLSPAQAVELLGTMQGGYNVPPLVELLRHEALGANAAAALRSIILVFDAVDEVVRLAGQGNPHAQAVLRGWAEAEWFAARPLLPERLALTVFRVDGEINTDDLSPAKEAPTRPDIPLHALSMGQARFPGGIETIAKLRADGKAVAFVGHTVGTGSSRKSATNSLIWHIGEDIPHVPNKRRGGVVIGESVAPIFFNTFEDAGGLPLRVDSIAKLEDGAAIVVLPYAGRVEDPGGRTLARFALQPAALPAEYRAGGRMNLIIGRKLAEAARVALGLPASELLPLPQPAAHPDGQGYTLAQKIVGRACGRDGVLPGETVEPACATVGSQDTTGPMTRDEMSELACLKFRAPMVMQSFCHTAAYPTARDEAMHRTLPAFITDRGGVTLKPGDGIIHAWLDRLLLPDAVGTGGDSHTRFPLGISFPAGSGLVAFAAALGCMPLEMPASVLVTLAGERAEGITLRDLVNYVPLAAMEAGLQARYGEGTRNPFNSRILEIEGTRSLTVEEAFELTCAAAERSAAAATVALDETEVAAYLRSNVALMKRMLADGYEAAAALQARIEAVERWLEAPELLRRDAAADYAAALTIDQGAIVEPVLACPNNPDNVAWLSAHAGREVDEVFIGSCMTNVTHLRAAARFFTGPGAALGVKRLWIAPPTRMEHAQLAREGVVQCFEAVGARVEIPGCSLCMGNQARVADGATVVSTSTRNFDNRMGAGAQVFLGSAAVAALTARLGRIPTPEEYRQGWREFVAPALPEIARSLRFDTMDEYAR